MKGTNGIKSGNAAVDGKVLYANRRYKDTIFRMLFSDRKNLLAVCRNPCIGVSVPAGDDPCQTDDRLSDRICGCSAD